MADVDTCQSPTVTKELTPEEHTEATKESSIEDSITCVKEKESATEPAIEENKSTETTEPITAKKNGNTTEKITIDPVSVLKNMTPTPEPEEQTPVLTSQNDETASEASRKTNDLENDVEMSDKSEMTKSPVEPDDSNDPKSPNKQNGDINGEHAIGDNDIEPMEVDEEAEQEAKEQPVSSANGVNSTKDTKSPEEDSVTESLIAKEETNDTKNEKTTSDKSAKLPDTVELLDESGEGEAEGDEKVEKKIEDNEKPTSTPSLQASESALNEISPTKPSNGVQEEESVVLDSDSEEEPMEVDGQTNGIVNDDDKPVSIGSDTDSESDLNTSQSNSRDVPTNDNSNDVHEILSDKEDDCVVIDDNKSSSPTSLGNRTAHDEDPLGAAHHSQSSASSSPVSFSINKNNKSPSLVVVDTAKLLGKSSTQTQPINLQKTPTSTASKTANLLPNLTDDMFVLEAPSFIVPYIYEKPPGTALKEVVTVMGKEVEEQVRREAEERRLKEESESGVREKQKKLLEEAAEKAKKNKKKQSSRRKENDDDEWDEEIDSSEDSDEEGEGVTRVLIKDVEDDLLAIKEHIITPETIKEAIIGGEGKKSDNFFESPLGKFFMGIGVNLVQEHVQTDLLRQQKRKRDREGTNPSESTMMAINSLMKNLETSKENNAPFKFELKRCEYCNFKSESALAMAHHYETPHQKNNMYRCNFCSFETKNTGEVMWHMEAMHNIKGRLEKPLSYHQCPNCTFEDNGRSKLARHSVACAKKFKPESNLSAPLDWDPPAKIPKIKPKHGLVGTATAYQLAAQQQQAALLAQQQKAAAQAAAQQQRSAAMAAAMQRGIGGRGQQVPLVTKPSPTMIGRTNITPVSGSNATPQQLMQRMMNQGGFNLGMSGGQYLQNSPVSGRGKQSQPSISITPVPRSSGSSSSQQAFNPVSAAATTKFPPGVSPGMKPGQNPNASGKTQFVICEICDGYIKDLDQLRNHMQWIHKVKIHPKMIYNRPPLNCQKCQYRFFTDQGLERHLLGSHGLVTSSMQEAANKGKDAGRCPVCGRVYQWKLLNHVSRDHNMTLKPAHLSYKCTVCTATFGMYKQFENHVYSAHSTVAKKSGDRKSSGGNPSSSSSGGSGASNNQSLLKPLKINDEITIIPQPSKPMIANSKPIEIE